MIYRIGIKIIRTENNITLPDVNITHEEALLHRKKMLLSMIIPLVFISLMWILKTIEVLFDFEMTHLGILPLTLNGIPGIVLSPFVHDDFRHLFNNTLPLFFLASALFYFYSDIAIKISVWTWFLTGLFVWLAGRTAWHIGASGLVYGLASFLFFSGIIRRYFRLVALSLLIVFLYGSMVWGIFPDVYKNVSWESHMLGFISGIVLAVVYRNKGPQEPVHEWLDEEDKEMPEGADEDQSGMR